MQKHVLTEKEAAAYINMSVSYLQKDRMNGALKNRAPGPAYLKIGRSVRYFKDDLDIWIQDFKIMKAPS